MSHVSPAPNRLVDAIHRISDEIESELAVIPVAPSPDQMLTTAELSALLSVSRRTLESWRAGGRGPKVTRVGGAVRYRYSDVIAHLREENPSWSE